MSKLINTIRGLIKRMGDEPNSPNFPAWKAEVAKLRDELRALVRAANTANTRIPFFNSVTKNGIDIELMFLFIFALLNSPLDEEDPPSQSKLDQIDCTIEAMEKEKVSEEAFVLAEIWRDKYEEILDEYTQKNSPSPNY